MTSMTTADWVALALSGELVVNIGQIDKATAAALNKQVRAGKLARCRGSWSDMLIGPPKTIWAAPNALWACGQLDRVVDAKPAWWAAVEALHAERAA